MEEQAKRVMTIEEEMFQAVKAKFPLAKERASVLKKIILLDLEEMEQQMKDLSIEKDRIENEFKEYISITGPIKSTQGLQSVRQ